MSTIYVMNAANLFVGSADPTNSQHLTLNTVKLPTMQFKTKEFMPGGGVLGLKVDMRALEPLVLTFKLHGLNPLVMNKFGLSSPIRHDYTVRGNIIDTQSGAELPLIAEVRGRMTKAEMTEFSRDGGVDEDFEINDISKYVLTINGQEKYAVDFFAGMPGLRIDGISTFGNAARNLGQI